MISRTSKLKIRKRGLDLSRLPLLNVFCLLVSCQLLVGGNKCGNLSIYLNAIKRFEALKRDLSVLCLRDQNCCYCLCSAFLAKAEN